MLRNADWMAASSVYGNAHASLIGLVVRWWTGPEWTHTTHTALEAAPSFQRNKGPTGAQRCDSVLLEDSSPAWILEVEGGKHVPCLGKMCGYFESKDFGCVRGGILLAYTFAPAGKQGHKEFPPPPTNDLIEHARDITSRYRSKIIALVSVVKKYEEVQGVRALSVYYSGRVERVEGWQVKDGECDGPVTYWSRG
jgi:hypothetical protein